MKLARAVSAALTGNHSHREGDSGARLHDAAGTVARSESPELWGCTVSTGGARRVKPDPDGKFCLVFQCETISVPVMRPGLGDTLRGLGVGEESGSTTRLARTAAPATAPPPTHPP